jgi:hypothetical protein
LSKVPVAYWKTDSAAMAAMAKAMAHTTVRMRSIVVR